jgi:hypothetical protein
LWLNSTTDSSSQTKSVDDSYSFLDNGTCLSPWSMLDPLIQLVQENSCTYTITSAETSNLQSNERYDIFMAPFDAAYPEDRWNYDLDLLIGRSFNASDTITGSDQTSKNAPTCQSGPETSYTPSLAALEDFDDPENHDNSFFCTYWYGHDVQNLLKGSMTIVGIVAFYLGVGFAMLVYIVSLWSVKRTRWFGLPIATPPSIARNSADPESGRAELDVQQEGARFARTLHTVNGSHPGTPFAFDGARNTTKALLPEPDVHELAASPTQRDDDIWHGPGVVSVNMSSVGPVRKSDDTADSCPQLTNVDHRLTSVSASRDHLEPGPTTHRSPSPIRQLRKTSKEPAFEMLTPASTRSHP